MGELHKRKQYAAVDIFKFFCAILVIFIHTKPFQNNFWLDAGVGLLTRFAVPYFFISSAVFLFKKINESKNPYKDYWKYFIRLLRLYAVWFVIFNTIDAIIAQSVRTPLWYIKQFFFCTNGSSLWFLIALLWATAIVFFLTRVLNKKIVFGIALVFWLIGYVFSTLRVLFVRNVVFDALNNTVIAFIGTQNGFFFAFPYVALAALFAGKDLKKSYLRDVILVAGFFVLLAVESLIAVKLVGSDLTFLWLAALPMTYFVMRLTLTLNLKEYKIYYFMRKSSTLIYVLHPLMIIFLKWMLQATGFVAYDDSHLVLTAATLIITIGLSILLVYLSDKKYTKFIKYIM